MSQPRPLRASEPGPSLKDQARDPPRLGSARSGSLFPGSPGAPVQGLRAGQPQAGAPSLASTLRVHQSREQAVALPPCPGLNHGLSAPNPVLQEQEWWRLRIGCQELRGRAAAPRAGRSFWAVERPLDLHPDGSPARPSPARPSSGCDLCGLPPLSRDLLREGHPGSRPLSSSSPLPSPSLPS